MKKIIIYKDNKDKNTVAYNNITFRFYRILYDMNYDDINIIKVIR